MAINNRLPLLAGFAAPFSMYINHYTPFYPVTINLFSFVNLLQFEFIQIGV